MQFISFSVILKRIKAIKFMMKDKTVPKRKKALIIAGLVYLFLPVDIIPPVIFPVGFLDDLIIWIWIIWHLRDTLDAYWLGDKDADLSQNFAGKDIVEGVQYNVDHRNDGGESGVNDGDDGKED